MLSTLFIINIILAVFHPLKHVPQCVHMIRHETADGLSMQYIRGELVLNTLTVAVSISMFMTKHHVIYLVPVIFEKIVSLSMIAYMGHLKQKYSHEESDDEYDCDNDWHSVSSDDEL